MHLQEIEKIPRNAHNKKYSAPCHLTRKTISDSACSIKGLGTVLVSKKKKKKLFIRVKIRSLEITVYTTERKRQKKEKETPRYSTRY